MDELINMILELTPTVTYGVVSKIINHEGKPYQILTTAVTHRGNSGGLLINT